MNPISNYISSSLQVTLNQLENKTQKLTRQILVSQGQKTQLHHLVCDFDNIGSRPHLAERSAYTAQGRLFEYFTNSVFGCLMSEIF